MRGLALTKQTELHSLLAGLQRDKLAGLAEWLTGAEQELSTTARHNLVLSCTTVAS